MNNRILGHRLSDDFLPKLFVLRQQGFMGRRRDSAARWPCPSACSWWAAGVPMPACWRWRPGWKRSWRRHRLSRPGAEKRQALPVENVGRRAAHPE